MTADPERLIGMRVSVKMSPTETHEGLVFTCDTATNALVLEQRKGADPKATYRIIKTTAVREIVVLEALEPPAEDAPEKPPLPDVNLAAVRMREERAIQSARDKFKENVSGKVTVRADAIMEAMQKTMPCTWMEKKNEATGELTMVILVLNEVIIFPPYTPDSARGTVTVVNRVKKVLAGELEKLTRAGAI